MLFGRQETQSSPQVRTPAGRLPGRSACPRLRRSCQQSAISHQQEPAESWRL